MYPEHLSQSFSSCLQYPASLNENVLGHTRWFHMQATKGPQRHDGHCANAGKIKSAGCLVLSPVLFCLGEASLHNACTYRNKHKVRREDVLYYPKPTSFDFCFCERNENSETNTVSGTWPRCWLHENLGLHQHSPLSSSTGLMRFGGFENLPSMRTVCCVNSLVFSIPTWSHFLLALWL